MKLIRFIYFFLFFLVAVTAESQELPPIVNYSPIEYGAENQNWSISQGENKYIYVANNSGLLEYNGAKWKLYPSPNNTFIRAINVINNKIYTGCFREFGFWERNEFGNLVYRSLTDELNEPLHEDEHIWNIISFDKWILFQSLHRIYIYNTIEKTFKIIKSKTQFPKVFKVENSIYFQETEKGVFKIENGMPILVSGHPILQKNILVNIYLIDQKVLFQTQEKGFYFLDDATITKWKTPSDSLISSATVYCSLRLKNGNFVLGTISNGIYELNENGELINKINQKKGLNNNTVLTMFEDQEQNLWLGLDNGLSMINFNSPYRIFNDVDGKIGAVYATVMHKNMLYLGTNQGLFFKRANAIEYEFIKGTKGQVWCLKIFDDTLFCGHNSGTFLIEDNKATLVAPVMGTWDIQAIKGRDKMLLQGNYGGLNVLEKIDNKWQYRNKIEGFDISSRYFGFDFDLNIYVSHEWKGVFKLSANQDFTKILDYNVEKSYPKGPNSSLIMHNNDLLYTSENGVFILKNTQNIFRKDTLLSTNLFAHDDYISGKLITDKIKNRLWGFTDQNIVYFEPAKLNNDLKATKISISGSSRHFVTGYENITYLYDQTYLLGTTQGYLLVALNKMENKEYEITLNSIEKSVLNKEKSTVSLNSTSNFHSRDNNLYFTYGVPEFDKLKEVNYSYQLKGIYNDWSEWSTTPEVSFKNLPFGSYSFNVKAKIGNELSKNTASYTFSIDRPWALSNLMLLIYTLFIVVLWFFIHNLYKRYYNKQKNRLIEKKQRIFALDQFEKEQEIMQLKNEKLKHDMDSKSRELATSTMSNIKKNEILNTIKNELKHIKDDAHVKPVIEIINKNLSGKGDWEMFREAFNNADSGFIKTVKTVHQNLTPNDLRLCAYLRLNLSSKEIAPLLNISPRSVEIKRYRLRKKMDLPHEKSLVEYILEI